MQVYTESQTFARKKAAEAWVKRRETELSEPGAIERAKRGGVLLSESHRVSWRPQLLRGLGHEKDCDLLPEVCEHALRMVLEHLNDHPSVWAAIEAIAPQVGCAAQTLHGWILRHQTDAGQGSGPTTEERERIKALERESRKLRKANEILRLASAYFAHAELDRSTNS